MTLLVEREKIPLTKGLFAQAYGNITVDEFDLLELNQLYDHTDLTPRFTPISYQQLSPLLSMGKLSWKPLHELPTIDWNAQPDTFNQELIARLNADQGPLLPLIFLKTKNGFLTFAVTEVTDTRAYYHRYEKEAPPLLPAVDIVLHRVFYESNQWKVPFQVHPTLEAYRIAEADLRFSPHLVDRRSLESTIRANLTKG